MEQLGPRVALERAEVIRRLRFIVQLIARGASLLPLFAYGHGGEFLEARLDSQNGVLQLNLVAEYGDNPMIADEAEARKVLADALRIEVGPTKTRHRLDELAPLVITPRAARDPESPMPTPVPDPGHSHQLLGASWSWTAPEGEASFFAPETSRQTVLFWLHTPGVSPPRWIVLVSGDKTPAIVVKHPWWASLWVWGAVLGGVLLVVMTTARYLRRSTSSPEKR